MIAEGGCLCGAVRYRFDAEPFNAGYCHCSMCRKASGAPVIAAASVPRDRLELLQGEAALVRYRSSPEVTRIFCGTCGGHLFFDVPAEPDSIDIWLGSLDAPDRVVPGYHIYTADAVAWHPVDDGTPRYPAGRGK
jgi:hypothetical protein